MFAHSYDFTLLYQFENDENPCVNIDYFTNTLDYIKDYFCILYLHFNFIPTRNSMLCLIPRALDIRKEGKLLFYTFIIVSVYLMYIGQEIFQNSKFFVGPL